MNEPNQPPRTIDIETTPQPQTHALQKTMKNITLVPAAGGAHRDLSIAPGTTPRDIRQQVGLPDTYALTLGQGTEPFRDDDNLYPLVPDGAKLFATTPVEVGDETDYLKFSNPEWKPLELPSWLLKQKPKPLETLYPPPLNLDWLKRREENDAAKRERPPPLVIRPSAPVIQPSTSMRRVVRHRDVVIRQPRPYWQERGWSRSGNKFEGSYRIPGGSWKGKAEVSPSMRAEMFIQNPPSFLKHHSHWSCFRSQWGGWYFIHTNDGNYDVSAGILRVEEILNEAARQN